MLKRVKRRGGGKEGGGQKMNGVRGGWWSEDEEGQKSLKTPKINLVSFETRNGFNIKWQNVSQLENNPNEARRKLAPHLLAHLSHWLRTCCHGDKRQLRPHLSPAVMWLLSPVLVGTLARGTKPPEGAGCIFHTNSFNSLKCSVSSATPSPTL